MADAGENLEAVRCGDVHRARRPAAHSAAGVAQM
jgi:hypothetical protein